MQQNLTLNTAKDNIVGLNYIHFIICKELLLDKGLFRKQVEWTNERIKYTYNYNTMVALI